MDGCYSFWQGACFCLLGENYVGHNTKEGPHWLFDQLSLQEYILICCQHPAGGLIDKPGKYVLLIDLHITNICGCQCHQLKATFGFFHVFI